MPGVFPSLILIWSCLACVGNGRRVQHKSERLQPLHKIQLHGLNRSQANSKLRMSDLRKSFQLLALSLSSPAIARRRNGLGATHKRIGLSRAHARGVRRMVRRSQLLKTRSHIKTNMKVASIAAMFGRRKSGESQTDVAKRYVPLQLHPELFDIETGWREEWFDPQFLEAWRKDTPDAWKEIIAENLPGEVFSCRMFSERFCDMLIEEVENFQASGLPARRPNSMNNYGLILNEIGWKPMVDVLQEHVLAKIAGFHWPHIAPFDDHHTFIVRYKQGEDLGLDMHTDASDVTFNICCGKQFDGAVLHFCGRMGQSNHRKHRLAFHHVKGQAVWHLGRLRHGAADIAEGERINLIIWNQCSAYRNSKEYRYPQFLPEEGPPDELCLSFTHDRDYGVFKKYTYKNKQFRGRGWSPRPPCEYDGFKQETKQ